MHRNKTKETRDTKNFPWGNHKGENPTTSAEIELAPKSKTQKHKDDLPTAIVSLSDPNNFSLTHAPQ